MEIYVQKNDQQVGPLSEQQLRDAVKSGEFDKADLAWAGEGSSWLPISSLLAARADSAPPKNRSTDTLDVDAAGAFGMEDGGEIGILKTLSLFKSLDYGFLIPFKKIFSLQLLRKRAVRWVLLLGLAPIVIYTGAAQFNLKFRETVWLYEIYFCIFWALYFYNLIKPAGKIWRQALGYAFFTVIIGVQADLLLSQLPVIRNLYAGAQSQSVFLRVLGFVFGVGVLEETVKALPLVIFGMRKDKITGVKTGLFLGFMSGLAFAAVEGVDYSFEAANTVVNAVEHLDEVMTNQLSQTVFRFMTGPLLHAVWSGSVGWFIGLAVTRKENRWPVVAVGIGFMALLHGLSDVFADTWVHPVLVAVSIIIFMAYLVHGNEEEQPSSSRPE